MRHARRTTGRCTVGLLLATVLAMWQAPAGADVGEPTGPVIFTSTGDWLIRNSPTGGNAERSFRYGRGSDLPVVGDWNGNGGETPGVARNTGSGTWQWHLRNSLTGGPADIVFEFGEIRFVAVDRLGSIPVAGNFDPSDAEYEVGVVLFDDRTGRLTWVISLDLADGSPTVVFSYGRTTDFPVVGDWDGDGVDTAGVTRQPNRWLLTNNPLNGGTAQLDFAYGSSDPRIQELNVPGDWDSNGTDTPGVLRNVPASQAVGGFPQWLLRNSNTGGAATVSFRYGSDTFTVEPPIEFPPRLSIELGP